MEKDLIESGIMRYDCGCYIIRQIMPYPLGETNVFLAESSDGWSVIDVGVDLPTTREVWEQALKTVGISFNRINHIYITHCHPDHMGAARWLQQRSGAPVYMLGAEIERAQKYIYLNEDNFKTLYRQVIRDKITLNRFPQDKMEELIEDWYTQVRPLYPEPVELLPLYEGDIIHFGGNAFEVLLAAGHTDGQSMFWSPKAKFLFIGDVLAAGAYLHFTDWPNSDLRNPLQNLFESFDRIKGLGVRRVFPGHGPVIEDLDSVIEGLTGKHRRSLDKVAAAVTAPISAGELYPLLYQMYDYVHHHRVVMGEVLGYLNYLTSRGKLVCNQVDGRIVYMPPLNAPQS